MPRNSGGTYTLPTGNPVVAGSTIEATWANNTLSDIATELTGSLSRAGEGGMTAALRVVDGTLSGPGVAFVDDTNTGLYRNGTDEFTAVAGGAASLKFTATGAVGAITSSSATLTGGTINNAVIGGTTAAAGSFTTLSASTSVTTPSVTNAGTLALSATGANIATISTDGSERVRVTSDGWLLVGKTASGVGTDGAQFRAGSFSGFSASGATALFINRNTNDGTLLELGRNGTAAATLGITSSALTIGTGGSERLRIDSAGNLGLGVTPSAWGANNSAIQMGGSNQSSYVGTFATAFGTNAYFDGSNWKYIQTGGASALYAQAFAGGHLWYTAPSGTAGNAITFTQAMTLDASGNLGVGTTSPELRLDVRGASADVRVAPSTTTNSAYFRSLNGGGQAFLGLDNSGGGLGGPYVLNIWHGGNYPIAFGTNNTERARITSGGDLLVGTTDASGSSGVGVKFITSAAGIQAAQVTAQTANAGGTAWNYYSTGASAFRFYVGAGGTVFATDTTISAISDQRLKENIQDLDVGLDAVMALKPRKFDWKAGKGKDIKGDRGWIAQEFEQVFPDMIDEWKDPAPEGEEPYKSVRADLIPVLVKAMQEQQQLIESLTARITALEGN